MDAFCLSFRACLSLRSSSSAICWKLFRFSLLLPAEDSALPLAWDSSNFFTLSGVDSSSWIWNGQNYLLEQNINIKGFRKNEIKPHWSFQCTKYICIQKIYYMILLQVISLWLEQPFPCKFILKSIVNIICFSICKQLSF